MRYDDLFVETKPQDPWADATFALNKDAVEALRNGPIPGDDDLESAVALVRLLREEFTGFGTDGSQSLSNALVALVVRASRSVSERLGVPFALPWRDFNTFHSFWSANGGYGSWAARRAIVQTYLGPVEDELERMEDAQIQGTVASPVTDAALLGWPAVDEELRELKRRFRTASTPQDYRDVGNRAVAVLEALSRTLYEPGRHLRQGETEPAVDKTKIRLGRFVEDSLLGPENAALRGLVRQAIEFAQSVKHSNTPTRREAGVAADAVILVANLLRRVEQPD